jgi:hypothetical protein
MTKQAGWRRIPPDWVCIAALIGIWLLFFWRILSVSPGVALSYKEGDFSGQFVAWAVYQGRQLFDQAVIPTWNPFNNGGHPFLGDTQAAVFYPPRLVVLAVAHELASLGGRLPTAGEIYYALQWESAFHYGLASLFMYGFIRRSSDSPYRFVAGMVAGLTFAYSGFLTGYPMLSMAVLEAAIWLPLMLWGVAEAFRSETIRWSGLVVGGVALGVSLHAGHPQMTHWCILITGLYLLYRVSHHPNRVRIMLSSTVLLGVVGGGLGAVMLLPGVPLYVSTARRAAFTFESQGNGFPISDLIQVIVPNWLTLWSPLYVGLVGISLVLLALWTRPNREVWFWGGVGLWVLLLSFGRNTVVYDLVYTVIPGFSWFRQQERAAFPVSLVLAILSGYGTFALFDGSLPPRYLRILMVILIGMGGITVSVLLLSISQIIGTKALPAMSFSLLTGALAIGLFGWINTTLPHRKLQGIGVILLIAFDLITVGHRVENYDQGSPFAKLTTPPLVQQVLQDTEGVYRVDGLRGVLENYGAIYGVQDIRGISPLRVGRYEQLLTLSEARLWEVLGVRYVFTPNQALPVPSEIVGKGRDPLGEINLHRIRDPRPFARLVTRTWIATEDQAAYSALINPDLNLRDTVILAAPTTLNLSGEPPKGTVTVTRWSPAAITLQVESTTDAILDLSLLFYGGWEAKVQGQPVPLLRSNLTLSAIELQAGQHTVNLEYRERGGEIGLTISLMTLIGVGLWSLWRVRLMRR